MEHRLQLQHKPIQLQLEVEGQEFQDLVTVLEIQETHQLFQQLVLPEAAEAVDKEPMELMVDQVVEVLIMDAEDQEILLQLVQHKEVMEVMGIVQVLHMQQAAEAVPLKQV